ncbi:lipoprotein 17-related variable surface protein [Metamycoplasma hyosynoviae]|uniref:lipoprotein 17-related variable surface protein n=1 Tax=Metamycoplasma hyosynoviae TaxID=29559 RepID=UPI002358CA2F|nr:lipoprotein 17-related variable surface protein [Metamycoplasma hyosynoviae]MDC8926871.1 lipoprotein 17-related variable surface protein [Metamycoplasma hyosynoviae]
MTKQSKIILLSSLITPPTCIPLLVISCTNEDPANEIKKVKVSAVSLDKLASEVTDSDIKITGYRTSVFTATQTHQVSSEDPTTLEVLVILKNIKKGTTAQKLFTIKSFKANPTEEIKNLLATELEKISGITVDDHTTKLANTITASDIKVSESSTIDKNLFEFSINPKVDKDDKTKIKVTIRLKHKKSGVVSKAKEFEITGFKNITPAEEAQLKNLENASRKVTVDVEGKENKLAKDVTIDEIKFTIPKIDGLIDDPEKYEVVEKSCSVSKTDSKNLEVYFQLKHKETSLVSSKRKLEVKGFKEAAASTPEEKALLDALNAVTLWYDGGAEALKKLDAGDLEIAKVKRENQKEGFEYSHKFKNDNATKDNYNNGYRTVVITAKKGSKSLSREVKLECFKSDYDVIIKQRDFIKDIKLEQTTESKAAVEALFTGGKKEADIYYDYTGATYYDKKYTEADKKPILDMKVVSWKYGTTFGRGKLVKLDNGNYKAYVTLGKRYKEGTSWKTIYDTKQTETKELSYEIIDKAAVNKIANDNKDKFDYPNKGDITVDKIEQTKITLPTAKLYNTSVKFNILSLEKDSENSKLIIKFQAEVEKITSEIATAEISGFKQDALGKEFQGMTVKYENNETVESKDAQPEKFELYKGSDKYNNGEIQVEKEIISRDEFNGKVKIKVTLKKGSDSVSKEFDVDGFKKKTFNLNDVTENDLTITFEGIDKSNTLPSTIDKSAIRVAIKEEYKTAIEITNIELTEPDDTNGSLKVNITVKDIVNTTSSTKTITKTETGFKQQTAPTKQYRLPQLYPESVSKSLIKVDLDKKDEIIAKFQSMKEYSGKKLLVIKKGIFYTAASGERIDGLSIRNKSITDKVNTNKQGPNIENIAKSENIGKANQKGLVLEEVGGKWIARWVLILESGEKDNEVFEQVLF